MASRSGYRKLGLVDNINRHSRVARSSLLTVANCCFVEGRGGGDGSDRQQRQFNDDDIDCGKIIISLGISLHGVAHDGKIDETNDAWWDLIIS